MKTTNRLLASFSALNAALFVARDVAAAESLLAQAEALAAQVRSAHERACWAINLDGRRHELALLRAA